MQFVVEFFLSMVLCFGIGAILYVLALTILDDEKGMRFKRFIPLYAKPKYLFVIFSVSGSIYYICTYLVFGRFYIDTRLSFLLTPCCVVCGSLAATYLAKVFHDSVEETEEEELKRKKDNKYNS